MSNPKAEQPMPVINTAEVRIPRVTITYCTQCRWLLRAAYFAQELLSTFSTAIGEVALQPATGGLFQVHLVMHDPETPSSSTPRTVLLWDRKTEGGFPETKVLKQKVRDCIEPGRDLGHSDKGRKERKTVVGTQEDSKSKEEKEKEGQSLAGSKKADEISADCEDCK